MVSLAAASRRNTVTDSAASDPLDAVMTPMLPAMLTKLVLTAESSLAAPNSSILARSSLVTAAKGAEADSLSASFGGHS